ncbi:LPXTG cell wall anchor domain-containing protein [Lactobacillus sp. Marseille-P7033]|nr:LPXTG cell wall anchor domain-containing protein [Lactobacillus sp. Marseille-P7033]
MKIWDDTSNVQLGQNIATQGDEGSAINFNGANQTVQNYLDSGYKFVSVVSDENGNILSSTSFDAANFGTFDTNPNSDQNFTVHLVHGTKPVNPENPTDKYTKNDLQKTSTRTINYVDANGNKLADSVTSTVVFSGSGYVDTVTGNLVNLNNDGSIKDQNGKLTWTYSVDGGNAQSGSSYTFAETAEKPTIQHDGVNYRFNNVNPGNYNAGNGAVSSYQVDNSKDNNLNVNVVYNKITYSTKRVNERTVNRTINYLDGKTGEKIPANLIADNPVNQSAKLYQTQIVDDQGNVKGIGTVNEDGTSYTIDNAWHVDGSFNAVTSPDLAKSGYKAPRFENGQSAATVSAETVNENTPEHDAVNVYYDHNEVPVTPDNPHGVDPKQLTKDVKETVHYIGAGDKTPADNVQTSKWTRTLTLDEVTKELVPNGQYDTEWAIAKGEKTNYDQVNTPVVNGYYANKANVPATAVTQSDIYTEVTYKPLGHIIPVDPTTGDPIPNAPQPQFPNDPTDPTKGNPGEKPTVPGYHPESGKPGDKVTPNPGNPGEDVKVPYVKDQGTVSVIFHDDTTDSIIPNGGFNSGDAAADTPVTYNPEKSISDLEKQGYVYVRTEGTLPDKVEANKNITVTVHMKHGVQPVTPTTPPTDVPKNTPKEAQPDQLTKKVNLTVNYVNADGTTFNGDVPANAKQTATFTGTAYVDKITGKLVNAKQEDGKWVINTDDTATPEIAWTSDKTAFEGVTSPTEEGYHVSNVSEYADGDNVAAITGLTKDSQDVTVTVTYAKNDTEIKNHQEVKASQVVKYVDENDNELSETKNQNFTFVYTGDTYDKETGKKVATGKWLAVSHDFNSEDVPVVDGYVAVKGFTRDDNDKVVAGGFTTAYDATDAKRNRVFKVVYKKVGKIVPQLPDGKPVPNVPNVPYTNDPTDPTAVTPDEPTPQDPTGTYTPEVPTVTPEVPTKDTPVIYHANEASLKVEYIDQDDNNAVLHTDSVDGKLGEKLTYTTADEIKSLEGQGYVLVSDGFTGKAGADFTKENNGKTYQVILKHGVQPVTPTTPPTDVPKNTPKEAQPDQLTKEVNLTVNYVNADGTKFNGNVPANAKQTATFTGTAYVDKITGQLVNAKQEDGKWVINTDDTATPEITWTSDKTSFEGVTSPAEENYHVSNVSSHKDGDNVAAITGLTKDSGNIDVTVTYAKNGTTVINGKKVTPTQTVKFVDSEGNELAKAITTTGADFVYSGDTRDEVTGQITKTGSWDSTSHIFGTQDVPVIDGYVAVSGYTNQNGKFVAGGLTATLDDPNVVATVVYQKVGNIVPQLPDGTPVPNPDKPGENVPNKPYTNDPTNPTDVNPKEPVPNIPGYRPEVPTVTPEVPTKDTPVVYNQIQKADLTIVDQDNGNKQIVVSGVTTKFATDGINGEAITFTGNEAAVKALENMGYVYVDSDFTSGTKFDGDGATDQHFTITMKHGHQPVNPNEPGKPGQPINPNDPEGPKYPQGSDQVTKNVTRTIQYVDENGNKVSDSVEQPVNFTAEGVLDKVTGQWVTPLTWSGSQTVNGVKSPVVEGYHLVSVDRDGEGNNVKGVTLTHENDSYTVTVKYAKNGKIIPVDPTGKPIPNVPTPQYPTDPTDPSKVTPNEPVPSIPGLTPEVPTVTPTDPGKNTPVKYSQTVKATVTYIDDVTGESLKTDSLSGLEGVKSDYSTKSSIDGYKAQGYKLVSDNFPTDGYTFSVEGTHDFTVHLTHSTSPVNPDHPGAGYSATDLKKTVTRTINYLDGQGNVVAQQVAQSFDFIANGTVDNVTGKLVTVADGKITGPGELTWTPAQDVKGVQSPAVNGMHVTFVTRDADGTNVKGVSLTHDDSSYDVYVNYAPNGTTNEHGQNIPASQTIKFVDENGNTLRENNVQTSEFVRTPDVVDAFTGKTITEGSWKETSHKFGVIDVPVIDGYVATVKTAGGLTATTDNPNVVTEVVYKKVGKIIPVDPTGKPIPNVPTPEYPNDPTDPTKVTPNEPVPTIPGYTPETPTVTPEVPTKDTPVKYTPVDNTQNAQVRYIDLTNNEEIANSGNLSGQPGDKINYSTADTIKSLTDKGYVLVNDGFPADAAFDNDKGHDQVFTVTFRHGTQPVNPNEPGKPGQPINPNDPEGPKYPQGSDQVTKNVTRTVQYVDENGNKISDPVEQTVNFTAEGVLDKVTGQWVTPLTWSGSQSVAGVKTPVVEGYHVVNVDRDGDGVNVKGVTLTHENDNYTVTVQYAKNGKIVPVDPTGKPIPNVPTPQYPTDPENPAKVTPDEPVPSIPGFVPEVPTVTPTDPGKDTPVHYTPVVNDQNAVVNYVDQDNNNAQIATSGNLTGKPGSLIDYSTAATIKQLEDQGYVLVSNGFPAGAVFDNDDNTTQTYTVVLKHGTTTFKPDKPGTPGEPINPNYPEEPKVTNEDVDYSKDVKFTVHYVGAGSNNPADNVQNAQWTRAITVDNVTGKIISSTEWVSNKDSYSNVATPVVEGYHADRAQVDGQKVTMEDQEATVTYVPNGKIVPVDPTGKPIPNVPTPQYPTDPTDPTKVTPNEPVPTIPNYTPEVPTVTPTDPGVDTPVKYTPNTVNPKPAVDQIAVVNYVDQDNNNAQIATSGNLTGKAGSVINYSTADEIKQLEAQGYVLVTDGFPAGATFDDNADQNQVFTVVLKHGTAPVGPKNPEEPGTPVNPGYPEGPKWPAKDNYTKDYTSTVHFVDNNGNKMRDDNVQTSTWTRTLIIDKVTGQILNPNENWTSDKASYNEVKVPVINGYVADKANVPAKEAVQQNIEDTVTYTKVGNIVPVDPSGNRIPNVPVVPYTNDPTDPTKVVPNELVPSVPGMTPNVTTVTPDHPTVDTPVVYTTPTPVTPQTPVTPEPETPAEPARPAETPAQPAAPEAPAAPKAATPAKATPAAKQEAKKLPQTGDENSSSAAALGLAALGLTGLLAAGKKINKTLNG